MREPLPLVAENRPSYPTSADSFESDDGLFPELNRSTEILVLVDEAHRSHTETLHANLSRALPNCARIGFTGTPIIMGNKKKTEEIFGPFIDRYTIRQSEADGATVPIYYEGRQASANVSSGRDLDKLFDELFGDHTPEDLEKIKARYATLTTVLEAEDLIAGKAKDILQHYVDAILPNGFKAQLVAVSRRAAVRYQAALAAAQRDLLARLESLDPSLLSLPADGLDRVAPEIQFLVRAHRHRATIRRLAFAAVISAGSGNEESAWQAWTDSSRIRSHIARFKRPLDDPDPTRRDGLAILCVKSMLLTGFDAPREQVLYLDRFMQGHELLQAIARVNRTAADKSQGLVVDYFGVTDHLSKALAAYSAEDIQGSLTDIRDELPKLADRHRRVLAVFSQRGLNGVDDVDACIDLLADPRLRHDFVSRLKQFLQTLDAVLPRPEALPYVRDARVFGWINKASQNRYRDDQLNLIGAGNKVRELIDDYVVSQGIDPKIPPISILDTNFDAAVAAHSSDRAKASEMEHAARHYITIHYQEDPVHYQKLSERLEAILQRLEDNWTELVEALRGLADEIREGPTADRSGLDPRTQAPFLRILVDETNTDTSDLERLRALATLTLPLVEHVRREIRAVDFWRNVYAQNELRRWLVRYLDDRDVVPLDHLAKVADRLVEVAKALHTKLTE